MSSKEFAVGYRGCCGDTKRGGRPRKCSQKAIVWRDGKPYCHYHDPENPHKFGERLKAGPKQ